MHLIIFLCSNRPNFHPIHCSAITSSCKTDLYNYVKGVHKIRKIAPIRRITSFKGNNLFRVTIVLPTDNKRSVSVGKISGSMANIDGIQGKSRVISARGRRRAHCCVAAGLLTGATELSVRVGTIRAISPPFGSSLA